MKIWMKSLFAVILGIVIGIFLKYYPEVYPFFKFIENLFFKFLLFTTKPLMLIILIVSFYRLKESNLTLKIFPPFFLITLATGTFAIIQSFLLGFFLKPGYGIKVFSAPIKTNEIKELPSIFKGILNFIPTSFSDVIGNNPSLLIPTFLISLFIGIAIYYAVKRGQIFYNFFQATQEIFEYISLYAIEIFSFFIIFITIKFVLDLKLLKELIYLLKLLIIFIFALVIQSYIMPALVIGFITKKNPAYFFKSISGAQLTGIALGSVVPNYSSIYFHSKKNLGISEELAAPLSSLGVIFNFDGMAIFSILSFFFLFQIFKIPFTILELITLMLFVFMGFFLKDGIISPEISLLVFLLSKAEIIPFESFALVYIGFFIFKRLSTFITTTSILTINFLIANKIFKKAEFVPHKEQI